VDPIRIDCSHQAYGASKLRFTGIAQELPVWAEHNRQFPGVDIEALHECPRFRIGFGIQSLARMAVAGKKALEPQHVAVLVASYDHRTARS
jgi:hypothetical protein